MRILFYFIVTNPIPLTFAWKYFYNLLLAPWNSWQVTMTVWNVERQGQNICNIFIHSTILKWELQTKTEDEQSILFETSRPNQLLLEPTLPQKRFTHGCIVVPQVDFYLQFIPINTTQSLKDHFIKTYLFPSWSFQLGDAPYFSSVRAHSPWSMVIA